MHLINLCLVKPPEGLKSWKTGSTSFPSCFISGIKTSGSKSCDGGYSGILIMKFFGYRKHLKSWMYSSSNPRSGSTSPMTLESDLDGFCKRQRQKNVHIRRLILQHCLVNFTLQFSHLSFYNIIQVVSLAFATFVCTLGREQQYFPNDQLSTAAWLAPPSWPRCWLAAKSLLLPETPWLEHPSWCRRWLAAESLSLLADLEGVAYRTAT